MSSLPISFVNQLLILGPDTKASYNTLIEVMKTVDFYQQGIRLTYQFNPLTWHFYSFKIHQGKSFLIQLFSSFWKVLDLNKLKSSFLLCLPIKTILLRKNGLIKPCLSFWTHLSILFQELLYLRILF